MARVPDLEEQLREELEGKAESFGRQTVERWVELANEHLMAATPPATASQDEWDMRPIADSVEIRQEGEKWVAEWEMESDDGFNIPDAFEFGAEPHDIEGNPLHFVDPETGQDVFRYRVQHPGIPAVAFIRFGKRRIEVEIENGDLP